MNTLTNDLKPGNAAVVAGIGLLIMAVIAPIANFAILGKILVPGDALSTLENLRNSEMLFRTAVCLFLVVTLLDILVAWALYLFLKPVNAGISLLAAWLRIVYAGMLGVAIIFLIQVMILVNGEFYSTALSPGSLQARVMLSLDSFNKGWEFSLVLFAVHLVLLGFLFYKAGYLRKILGVLLLIAGFGYLVDGIGRIFSASYDLNISMYTFVGEVVLMFWLLIQGRKAGKKRTPDNGLS